LVCSVQYAQDYPVLWMRIDRSRQSDGLPISTGSTLIIRDSRFSLRYDTASSTYTLQVRVPYTACLKKGKVMPLQARCGPESG